MGARYEALLMRLIKLCGRSGLCLKKKEPNTVELTVLMIFDSLDLTTRCFVGVVELHVSI